MRDTIDMAFEAKLICAVDDPTAFWPESHDMTNELKAFAALVRADEREACAKIAEEPTEQTYECTVACGGPAQTFQQRLPTHSHDIAKEIRARSKP
jgi:hypothetical protein